MKFDRPQTVSFEPVDNGEYIGVIVGFAFVGTHPTEKWGNKQRCMIRWELHDLDPPHEKCVDQENRIHVTTQTFPATIAGESSWLWKCLVAHGIAVPGGSCTESKEWYGQAAKLTMEQTQGNRGDKFFSNVTDINPLDAPVKIVPFLNFEHWEPEDNTPPPMWSKAQIEKSMDLYHLVTKSRQAPAQQGNQASSDAPYQAPYQASSQGESSYSPPAVRYQAPPVDDDDIPFAYPLICPEDDIEWIGLKW